MKTHSRMRALMAAALVAAAVAPAARAASDGEKALKQGLRAGDKGAVVAALEKLGEEDDEKAAKTILAVALNADELNKGFDAKATNEIFDAAQRALAGMTSEKALEFIYKGIDKNRDQRVRIILVEVAGTKADAPAEQALIDALQDRHPTVAATAARILGARKTLHDADKVVNALIDVIDKTEKDRREPWQDVMMALIQMSGQQIDVADDWRNWWKGAQDTFKPGQRGSKGMSQTVLREAPKLFGKEILSKRVVFVLDVSGSMAIKDPSSESGGGGAVEPKDPGYGNIPPERMRMNRLKEAMIEAIKGLPQDTRFTIVTFSSTIRTWKPKLTPASGSEKADAIDFTRGMNPSGFTWTDTALEQAFEIEDANAIYLFSDGIPQRGKAASGGPDYIDRAEILEKVRQWNRVRKVKIYTFGFGEADAAFMSQLANENGGDFTAVK